MTSLTTSEYWNYVAQGIIPGVTHKLPVHTKSVEAATSQRFSASVVAHPKKPLKFYPSDFIYFDFEPADLRPLVPFVQRETLLPEAAGIYFLWTPNGNTTSWGSESPCEASLRYIGLSRNLRSRWAGDHHHIQKRMNAHAKQHSIITYFLADEDDLAEIELKLIREIQPSWNTVGKATKRAKTKRIGKPRKTKQRSNLSPMEAARQYARDRGIF